MTSKAARQVTGIIMIDRVTAATNPFFPFTPWGWTQMMNMKRPAMMDGVPGHGVDDDCGRCRARRLRDWTR